MQIDKILLINGKEVILEHAPCPMGCPGDDEYLFSGRDRLQGLPGEFAVVRCRTCGLIRTNPRPTRESMDLYYPDSYGPFKTPVNTRKNSMFYRCLRGIARKVFRFNATCMPPVVPGRLLEIGCATGRFMHEMAGRGWDVAGIESSPRAAEMARGLGYSVHAGPVTTAPAPRRLYDIVAGWMVIEHLHEPIQALQKIYEWTTPDGWFVFSVPDAGSLEFRAFKDYWYGLHLPNHLYHFTTATIHAVTAKAGWDVRAIRYQRNLNNFFPSIAYLLADIGFNNFCTRALVRFPDARIRPYLLYPIACFIAMMGQTGRITVWARKTSGLCR